MLITIKPKPIIAIILSLIISLLLSIGLYKITKVDAIARFSYTIIVDAGHGGRDAGTSGINTGVKESDINLSIAKKLQQYLSDFGFNVVMTRETQDGLYRENVSNYKKDDMLKREQIIKKNKPNMLISIHQNSYSTISEKGAQAFYEPTNELSKNLSNSIQNQLINNLPNARNNINKGDYFLLKNQSIPCSIVECGFLSNPDEESLLTTEAYQQKVAYAIFCGVINYLNAYEGLLGSIENYHPQKDSLTLQNASEKSQLKM